MLPSALIGISGGAFGVLLGFLLQWILNLTFIINDFIKYVFLVPLFASSFYILIFIYAKKKTAFIFLRTPWIQIFEGYHFGFMKASAFHWFGRFILTTTSAFFGGGLGIEGCFIELNWAFFDRYLRNDFSQKKLRIFVVCSLATSFCVVFKAPFSSILLSIELFLIATLPLQLFGLLSVFIAHAVSLLFTQFVPFNIDRLSILNTLFLGIKPTSINIADGAPLCLMAALIGAVSFLFSKITTKSLLHGDYVFSVLFPKKIYRIFFTGILLSFIVWLTPDFFHAYWQNYEKMTWLQLSSTQALIMLGAFWVLFVFTFSGWGSTGTFLPILTLGAFLGYTIGNTFQESWALPLAITGAVCMLSSTYHLPFTASALVLEIGKDHSQWITASVGILICNLLTVFFKDKNLCSAILEGAKIRLFKGKAIHLLAVKKAGEMMRKDFQWISDNCNFEELKNAIILSRYNALAVLSQDGIFLGMLILENLPERLKHVLRTDISTEEIQALERVFSLREFIHKQPILISPEDNLEKVFLGLQTLPYLFVLDANCKPCGIINKYVINGYYERAVVNQLIQEA